MSENIIEVPAIDAVNEQYYVYGEYVNLHRHIPYIYDGLKPSYRRVIQASFDVAKDKLAKTATIVGRTIGAYHPHGDASVGPIVSELVHAGILKGKGNHGAEMLVGEDLPPAAPRYTEAMVSDNYKKLLTPLLGEVPTFQNEYGNTEYEYLPTPIPLGLTFGYLGIGIGTGCKIPSFSPESILDAYLNNDYRLLKSASGIKITNYDDIFDSSGNLIKESGLKSLWNTGDGRIQYEMDVDDNGYLIRISGSKGELKLDWSWLMDMRAQGRVEINELTSGTPMADITKAPRVQWPTHDLIHDEVYKMTRGGISYYVRVVYNNQVRLLGLYDWIDITYKNYKRLYKNHIDKEIQKLKWDIKIFENFREVADQIINKTDKSYESIASDLGVELEVVNAIGKKSINTLRIDDPKYKIPKLTEKIEELNKFDIDNLIKSNISLM